MFMRMARLRLNYTPMVYASSRIIAIAFISVLAGCKKLVQVSPPTTAINSADVYSTDATAIAAVTAIYSSISSGGPYTSSVLGISTIVGLSADELTLYPGASVAALPLYYTNNLNNDMQFDFWPGIYQIVYIANAALEGLNGATGLTKSVQQQLIGEAEFDRAFLYFYLVNLYGDVPLVLTSDYAANATLAKTPQAAVWVQIIEDLHNAAQNLSSFYIDGTLINSTNERLRPTKWAALSLLARAYLYNGNWAGADSAATAVIGNSALFNLNTPDSVFLMNSSEAIWQLQPVIPQHDVPDAYSFILPASGPNSYPNFGYLNDSLVNAFDSGDLRRADWVDSVVVGGTTFYYPYKYKNDSVNGPLTEYIMVLRLGEQFLIRAEAKANEAGGVQAAIADLNTIRSRANLGNYSGAMDQTSILVEIMHQRQLELFTEWGDRWLNLKRTKTIDIVMGTDGACALKGGQWNTNAQLYPIPLYDLQSDPNLILNDSTYEND